MSGTPLLCEVDVEACVTSGQMFRWKRVQEDWIGRDGPAEYVLKKGRVPDELSSLFRLSEDHRLQHEDSWVGELARKHGGLRLLKPKCRMESLFSFLCSSNNHVKRIEAMVWNGAKLSSDFSDFRGVSAQSLRSLGFGYRAEPIAQVLNEVTPDMLEELSHTTYPNAFDALIKLPGVGRKLADCIALYALHFTEAFPIDTHVWQSLTHHLFPDWSGTSLTERKYREVGDKMRHQYGPRAAFVQQFLFFENRFREKLPRM